MSHVLALVLALYACPLVAAFITEILLASHINQDQSGDRPLVTIAIFALTILPAAGGVFAFTISRGLHWGFAIAYGAVSAFMVPFWLAGGAVLLLLVGGAGG